MYGFLQQRRGSLKGIKRADVKAARRNMIFVAACLKDEWERLHLSNTEKRMLLKLRYKMIRAGVTASMQILELYYRHIL